jgi:pimeloyl-ACP methyl ester carboxylesterase
MRRPAMAVASSVAALAALLAAGCLRLQPATVPMRTLDLVVSQPPHRRLVVLLPGRYGSPENFSYAQFAAVSIAGRVPADVIAADARVAYYFHGNLIERLHQDVILPARARGYDQIFLAGVSLGATSALLYLGEHPQEISGVLLMSPYLGKDDVVGEVVAAGGLARWQPPAAYGPADFERRAWAVLKRMTGGGAVPLYLAYGDHDRFLTSDRLLAAVLPAGHVLIVPGHHDWPTWRVMWSRFLATGALEQAGGGSAAASQ